MGERITVGGRGRGNGVRNDEVGRRKKEGKKVRKKKPGGGGEGSTRKGKTGREQNEKPC
jgi:hypothetical protein